MPNRLRMVGPRALETAKRAPIGPPRPASGAHPTARFPSLTNFPDVPTPWQNTHGPKASRSREPAWRWVTAHESRSRLARAFRTWPRCVRPPMRSSAQHSRARGRSCRAKARTLRPFAPRCRARPPSATRVRVFSESHENFGCRARRLSAPSSSVHLDPVDFRFYGLLERETDAFLFAKWKKRKNQTARVGLAPDETGLLPGIPGKRCAHCNTQTTPLWRNGPDGAKTLCNACGVRYKAGRVVCDENGKVVTLAPQGRKRAASATTGDAPYASLHKRVKTPQSSFGYAHLRDARLIELERVDKTTVSEKSPLARVHSATILTDYDGAVLLMLLHDGDDD